MLILYKVSRELLRRLCESANRMMRSLNQLCIFFLGFFIYLKEAGGFDKSVRIPALMC